MNNDIISINKDWVAIEDYQFKILILTSVLAENKILILTSVLAEKSIEYRGTLSNMCEWLGIANVPKNTKQIKQAIKELQDKEYIFYHEEGRTHHISITNKGLKDKRIVKVKRKWIDTIKDFNIAKNGNVNRSWDIMTKALITILWEIQEQQKITTITDGVVITMKQLGAEIDRCETTTGTIINKLTECNFDDGLKITKKTLYRPKEKADGTIEPRAIGTQIRAFYNWENEEAKQ